MRPFLPEKMIQEKTEEQIALIEDRIDECRGKLLSLEGDVSGVTPASVVHVDSSAAAPMDEEPSETATSMLDLASDGTLIRGHG